jgi:hypothetical protein
MILNTAQAVLGQAVVWQACVRASNETDWAANEEAVVVKFAVPYVVYFVFGR